MRLTSLLLLSFLILAPCTGKSQQPAKRWWKGNLHTHTLWSDGDDFPEMIAEWYKERGYHFLALSDHNILLDHENWALIAPGKRAEVAFPKYLARFGAPWVEQRLHGDDPQVRLKMLSEFRSLFEEPDRFLMIASEEISGAFLKAGIHVNATNIREKILPSVESTPVEVMQKMIDAVMEQRQRIGVPMFPHVNHPNFQWAITAEDLMKLDHEKFFEVYNGHPQVYNEGDQTHASTDRVWDIILTARLAVLGKEVMYGLGTDDSHNYHNEPKQKSRPGRGWIMVTAAKLTVEEIIAAMEAGNFYASSGVTLKEIQRTPGALSLEIEPQEGVTYSTEFIGTRKGYDPTSQPVTDPAGNLLRVTRRYSEEIGEVLAKVTGTTAKYELTGDEIYVRARVTSSKGMTDPVVEGDLEKAWVQPLVTGVK